MKRTNTNIRSYMRSAIIGEVPAFDWQVYKEEWSKHKNHDLVLEEAQEDLQDRDADLKAVSARTTPLVTISTVLLAAYGLQQKASLEGWVSKTGIFLTACAIVVVLWSHMPSWKVWTTNFEDAGWWVLKTDTPYDRFVKVIFKTHVRNHVLTRVRRLQSISFSLVILSVVITALAFMTR